jgi:hypothetical protein
MEGRLMFFSTIKAGKSSYALNYVDVMLNPTKIIYKIVFIYFSGLMPDVDYAILSEWYNWIQENEDMHIDLIGKLNYMVEDCLHLPL